MTDAVRQMHAPLVSSGGAGWEGVRVQGLGFRFRVGGAFPGFGWGVWGLGVFCGSVFLFLLGL